MRWTTGLLLAVLAVVVFFALRSAVKRLTRGCCGTGSDAGKRRRVRVVDRRRAHYPYRALLTVDGMVCGQCGRRVAEALEAQGDLFAEVDVTHGRVTVYGKHPLVPQSLRDAVNALGPYTVLSVECV